MRLRLIDRVRRYIRPGPRGSTIPWPGAVRNVRDGQCAQPVRGRAPSPRVRAPAPPGRWTPHRRAHSVSHAGDPASTEPPAASRGPRVAPRGRRAAPGPRRPGADAGPGAARPAAPGRPGGHGHRRQRGQAQARWAGAGQARAAIRPSPGEQAGPDSGRGAGRRAGPDAAPGRTGRGRAGLVRDRARPPGGRGHGQTAGRWNTCCAGSGRSAWCPPPRWSARSTGWPRCRR